jgi:hypothetical protein
MTAPTALPVDVWPSAGPPCALPGSVVDETITGVVEAAATRILYALSGRKYGTRTETVRPAVDGVVFRCHWCLTMWAGAPWQPFGAGCARCMAADRRPAQDFRLPRYPIVSIGEVRIDGAVLASASYRVDDYQWLVRTDGELWPTVQDVPSATSAIDTWSITYTWGHEVPADGQLAMRAFSCELLKLVMGQDCELPQRVTSVSRGSMSAAFLDPMDFLEEGRTGVYLVDLFLKTVNPTKSMRPSRVFRPDAFLDTPTPRRTTS